ncbi:MAG: DUF3857 domain-containing protein [Cytophagales bacterium]|nr:MAG: DUF3857 domain-containing protein [Cytophagales bacterium]TAF61328.1 MAG: DUF3857 domain-containing protein [Cytophagales bacterium]
MRLAVLKNCLLFVFIGVLSHAAFADKYDFNVSRIPPELLKNACVVTRFNKTECELLSIGEMLVEEHYAYTILNEDGRNWALITEGYDQLSQLQNISCNLYDKTGKKLNKFNEKDFRDIASEDGISMVTDNRIKVLDIRQKTYPYTVEVEVKKLLKNLLYYPKFIPQTSYYQSVQAASFNIKYPLGLVTLQYKSANQPMNVKKWSDEKFEGYYCSVTKLPAIDNEGYSRFTPSKLIFIANKFHVQGYEGSQLSWHDIGVWYEKLNQGRDKLSGERVNEVRQLVAGITDQRAKVKKIYEFMQNRTRYVSIQLGIGGWQTMTAEQVDKTGYGDCKALSNYTKALLAAVGIESYYALIYAGDNRANIIKDFSAPAFNHAILVVPIGGDLMWLECTNQTAPAGYMGDFTDDRYALLVKPTGGELVTTVKYSSKDNVTNQNSYVKLDANGNAQISSKSTYIGIAQDDPANLLRSSSKSSLEEWQRELLGYVGLTIKNVEGVHEKLFIPTTTIQTDFEVNKFASKTGKRMFLQPNVYKKSTPDVGFLNPATRKSDIYINRSFEKRDTVVCELPQGYKLESPPETFSRSSPFGSYQSKITCEGNLLTYTSEFILKEGEFPKDKTQEFIDFIKAAESHLNLKVVLVSL